MQHEQDVRAQLQAWLRGETPPTAVGHWIDSVLHKALVTGALPQPETGWLSKALETPTSADYAEVTSRAADLALEAHENLAKESAPSQDELEELVSSETAKPWYRSWKFVQGLLIQPWEIDHPDPERAVSLARYAVRLALTLSTDRYGATRVEDLRAYAYVKLGNALRIQTEFRDAERAFQHAGVHMERGTGDPLLHAHLKHAEASLLGSQQKFDAAFHLLDQVVAVARRLGERHLQGKALISRAYFESNAERPDEALRLLHRGLRLIDPAREPRLVLVAWHNLTLTLTYQNRYREAAKRLPYIRSLHEKFGNRMDQLRLQWIEGRIDLARGEEHRAEATLSDARKEFIDAGIGFDAALVSLDLAHVYARQGRSKDMRHLAQEMIPIFESRDMHREAIAALLVFKKATEMDQVSVHLVEDLTAFLRRSRGNPKLRFRPDF